MAFSELLVSDYKQWHNLKLSKLSRINIFAGTNNSGKTILLEAIYLLCRQNDSFGLLDMIRQRGKIAEDQFNPEWQDLSDELTSSGSLRPQG